MKTVVIVISILLVTSLSAQNMVLNPSFEDGERANPDYWTSGSPDGEPPNTEFIWETEGARTGEKCVSITRNGQAPIVYWNQGLNDFNTGERYDLSVYAKTEESDLDFNIYVIMWMGGRPVMPPTQLDGSASSDWSQTTHSVNVQNGVTSINVQLIAPFSEGKIYFDDVVFGDEENNVSGESRVIANQFTLNPAFPNPFNSSTSINYSLPFGSNITIQILDQSGRQIESFFNGFNVAGNHTIDWNESGASTAVYWVVLSNGEQQLTQQVLLVK